MTGWSPGISFDALVAEAPITYVRDHLGQALCRLLDLLDGGTADEARLRAVAGSAIDVERLITDDREREALLTLVPQAKQIELLKRLDEEVGGAPPLALLNGLRWTTEQRAELLEFLGFIAEHVRPPEIPARQTAEPEYGLFPHQRTAIAKVKDHLYEGYRRVALHLPTGAGKTRCAMNIVADHLRERGPALVVWLAHGQELLEQAAAEFGRAWSKLGDRSVTIVRCWGDAPGDVSDVTDGIVVLGLEKAVSTTKRDPDFLRYLSRASSLIVFDEAHQIIAPTYQQVADTLTVHPKASLLGLTATPGRTWSDVAKDEELSEFFLRQKVMLELDGYTNPVTGLIDQGYLSRPTITTAAADAGLHLSTKDLDRIARSFDIPKDLVDQLADHEQWNLQVIQTALDLAQRHLRILIFAASVEHCRLIAAVLSTLSIDADFVTGDSSPRHRKQVITRFKSDSRRTMVLCNYGVLTTGFDAPKASAAIIARPTKSLVLYSQMVGRVIRGPRAGGTPTCEIVTVVDPDLPGFGDIAKAFTNWEDVWETA